ncbi:hypothetical protein AEM51_05560 [Bacteroidetes bacterium UKL13-3]|jgi:uncharacterized Fe-S cluster protein YjdI|nr:hypothetical protein AEM51_05560 [Bacteroidetes bacterium UKL13-3]HCP94775.1 hypothetical protein [Bacteroidota bacterium]
MKEITKKYSNGDVTIAWKNAQCIHSTLCWKGLSDVFNPTERPWIKPEGAPTQAIIEQIKKCPSGALTYYMNDEIESATVEVQAETIVEPTLNGPLMVYGNVVVKDAAGNETRKNKATAFCRCGKSSNKPYCDGTHRKVGFEG